jgi:hypothetical protein
VTDGENLDLDCTKFLFQESLEACLSSSCTIIASICAASSNTTSIALVALLPSLLGLEHFDDGAPLTPKHAFHMLDGRIILSGLTVEATDLPLPIEALWQ